MVALKAMFVILAGCLNFCLGFAPTASFGQHPQHSPNSKRTVTPPSSTRLWIGEDFFESFKNFMSGGKRDDQSEGLPGDADLPAGTTTVATIPVHSIKPGGLRLFLMFYLMGMQNTPDKGTWQANQPSSDDYVVEMFFRDATAMLTIELSEDEIAIRRCGSMPSTPYLMQESVIIEGILDELEQCANEKGVAMEDRLLVPKFDDAIEMARGSVSFG